MKHLTLIATSVAALGLAACNQSADRTDEAANTTTEAAVTTDVAAPTVAAASPGQAFANTAAASDTFEIESSKLAETNAELLNIAGVGQS